MLIDFCGLLVDVSGVPMDVGGLPVDVRISVDVRPVVVVCLVDVL